MKQVFTGKVDANGVLRIVNRKEMDEYVRQFAGKDLVITIEKKKSKRSNSQNAYYHACCVPIVREGLKELGHRLTLAETHEFLKMRFLKEEMLGEDGLVIGERTKSTTELNKSDFADYVAQIQQFAAEYLGVTVPDPNEQVTLLN